MRKWMLLAVLAMPSAALAEDPTATVPVPLLDELLAVKFHEVEVAKTRQDEAIADFKGKQDSYSVMVARVQSAANTAAQSAAKRTKDDEAAAAKKAEDAKAAQDKVVADAVAKRGEEDKAAQDRAVADAVAKAIADAKPAEPPAAPAAK